MVCFCHLTKIIDLDVYSAPKHVLRHAKYTTKQATLQTNAISLVFIMNPRVKKVLREEAIATHSIAVGVGTSMHPSCKVTPFRPIIFLRNSNKTYSSRSA